MTPQILTFILDDDTNVAEYFEHFLNKEGLYNIQSFTDPDDFKQALSDNVQLVLLDINIPGVDYSVFSFVDYIRDYYPGIHIIVISGYLNEDLKTRLWEKEVFFAVDKNGITFIKDLERTLERLKPRLLRKLNALA